MNEREALRAQSVNLLQRLRSETIPQTLFELMEIVIARLDRLELGAFDNQDEVPTEPGKNLRTTSAVALPVQGKGVGERVKKIFEDVKDDDKQKP
jgi:hypothetical protein